jgi:hypothetical protein
LPRHSTVNFSPGLIAPISTSTAAPAALARSEGLKELTNGTTAATPPTAPTQLEVISHVRLLVSTVVSLMEYLKSKICFSQSRKF